MKNLTSKEKEKILNTMKFFQRARYDISKGFYYKEGKVYRAKKGKEKSRFKLA